MDLPGPPRRLYKAQIFTCDYKIDGQLETIGQIVNALNNADENYIAVRQASVWPLAPDVPLASFRREQIILSKLDILFISLTDEADRTAIRLLQQVERAIVHTPLFVLRGNIHLGGEVRVRDMFDTMLGAFVPITDASLFPLCTLRTPLPQACELVFLNKRHAQLYYAEG